jgi:hypothetical protein
VALDRALTADPGYSMATVLQHALDLGAPPSMARMSMTPEEVVEWYTEHYRAASGAGDNA